MHSLIFIIGITNETPLKFIYALLPYYIAKETFDLLLLFVFAQIIIDKFVKENIDVTLRLSMEVVGNNAHVMVRFEEIGYHV
jgi:hypothetical protein